jgi:hypothetical protein
LCHVEIERDNRGRIAYIYPTPPQIYLLPWKNNGRWMAVIGGCPSNANLRAVLKAADELSIEVFAHDRGSPLLPPRWLLCSDDLENLLLAAAVAGMTPTMESNRPILASTILSDWAASIEEWQKRLHWLEGPAPPSEQEFNPNNFRMACDEQFRCPCRLISIEDSLTKKHRWHILSHSPIDPILLDNVPYHAFLLDPTWGKWLSMSKIAEDFPNTKEDDQYQPVPLPYEKSTGSLYVPASLAFPTMLSRALLTCSGMPPALGRASPYFAVEDSMFVPSGSPPYTGNYHRYDGVPLRIAEPICRKVLAVPVSVNP